jgi:uncharacterized membrane protein SpoIIM required for sporulation
MREAAFIRQNKTKWKEYETVASTDPDVLADRFITLTDDLSFARTFYPESEITHYLNNLTGQVHQALYKNKKERKNRFVLFWKQELPGLIGQHHRQLFFAFLIFAVAIFIGALSAAYDDTFVRLILGDSYVNKTIGYIQKGDPMAIYKQSGEVPMFLGITFNNIKVSFMAFAAGAFFSVGTFWILLSNGIMVGAFHYFFYKYGLLVTSVLSIWIHGTLELSAIVVAGSAGFVMGNSILFPKTYSRLVSFRRGAREGLKMVVGLVPIFVVAGFLEGFVTRHTEMPLYGSVLLIGASASFICFYFIFYPYYLYPRKSYGQSKH